jgi:hypothetical protein
MEAVQFRPWTVFYLLQCGDPTHRVASSELRDALPSHKRNWKSISRSKYENENKKSQYRKDITEKSNTHGFKAGWRGRREFNEMSFVHQGYHLPRYIEPTASRR